MAVRTVSMSTHLPASPETVWDHVQTPRLLHHVAWPLIRFVPKGARWPAERWTEGRHETWMFLFGFLPIGWQVIGIELPTATPGRHVVRDNGYGPLIRRWDHWIEIEPEGCGARYTDIIHIDAGWLTAVVTSFAKIFYRHRQRRWRNLVNAGFAYQ
jgi:hypothetical protein